MITIREQIEQLHCVENQSLGEVLINHGCSEWGADGAYTRAQVEEIRANWANDGQDVSDLPELLTADVWLRANGYVWRIIDEGIDSGELNAYHSEDTLDELAEYWSAETPDNAFDIEIDGDWAFAVMADGSRSEAAKLYNA